MTPPGFEPRRPPLRGLSREQRREVIRRRRQVAVVGLLTVTLLLAGLIVLIVGGNGGHPNGSAAGRQGGATTTTTPPPTTTTLPPPYLPPAVVAPIAPALAGEGQWTQVDTWDPGPPSILTTTFRPDPAQPGITAYAAWMRTQTTQLALYLGYKGPGPSTLDRGPEMVPQSAWPSLLATFNSGFYEADSAGGFYVHGTLYFPMVNGLATVVEYTSGTVDIVDWAGGPTPGPDIEMARQNLPMLVDAGAATPAANVPSTWGVTLGGVPAVWRTGLGVDAQGNLIYVAAPAQTAASLARILLDVGSVRAMQLDINPEWPIFVSYGGAGAASPSLFVPNPNQVSDRFLYSSTKDFFAVFVRTPGTTEQPW
ncbi:MAG TPA: hypothetical protein VN781_07950 [Acidimicrobiales bacterium]|nr:hypothetical protein [Acidimicrobiales bacterium]